MKKIGKCFEKCLLPILLFFALASFLSFLMAINGHSFISFGDLKDIIITAIGAFTGAFFAFLFQNRTQKKLEEDKHYLASRTAHHTLLEQNQLLVEFWNGWLKERHNNPIRAWQLLPTTEYQKPLVLDMSSLMFMLEKKGFGELDGIRLSERTFLTILNVTVKRNELSERFLELCASIEREDSSIQGGYLYEEAEGRMGKQDAASLVGLTDELFDMVPRYILNFSNVIKPFESKLKEIFPNRHPIISKATEKTLNMMDEIKAFLQTKANE